LVVKSSYHAKLPRRSFNPLLLIAKSYRDKSYRNDSYRNDKTAPQHLLLRVKVVTRSCPFHRIGDTIAFIKMNGN